MMYSKPSFTHLFLLPDELSIRRLRTIPRKRIGLSRAWECQCHILGRQHLHFLTEPHSSKPWSFLSLFAGSPLLFPRDPFADRMRVILRPDAVRFAALKKTSSYGVEKHSGCRRWLNLEPPRSQAAFINRATDVAFCSYCGEPRSDESRERACSRAIHSRIYRGQ